MIGLFRLTETLL